MSRGSSYNRVVICESWNGAGADLQTTPESDGGNLVSKAKAYALSPQALCP